MRHLKTYKLFESLSDVADLKEIEELFYPISDDYYLGIEVKKSPYTPVNFTKPMMCLDSLPSNKMDKIPGNARTKPSDNKMGITVFITKSTLPNGSVRNVPNNTFDVTRFEHQLKFPIDYIEKEKGLKLKMIYGNRQETYQSNYPRYIYYQDIDTLLDDKKTCMNLLSLVLYFGE